MGIIHREASQKRWKRVNKAVGKVRGGLTLSVKVPMANGGYNEYKTKEGVYGAVSPIIFERFQSANIAPCHRGTFFKDVGHLADGPVAQQILEGTYEYPPDLDPATRFFVRRGHSNIHRSVSGCGRNIRDSGGFPALLANNTRENRVVLQRIALWPLRGGFFLLEPVSAPCRKVDDMCKERDYSNKVEDGTHCPPRKDNWERVCPQAQGNLPSGGRLQLVE